MVAAGHPLTAHAGAEALARGGNAVDAAVAAAFAAAVAETPLTGPGAGGFLLVRAPDGEATLYDFFVAAPGLGPDGRALDPRELSSFTVPFGGADQVFHIGPASVAVPGLVPGVCRAVARHGRLPLPDLVAPAARIARDGVRVTQVSAYLHKILEDMLGSTPACAAMYQPLGRAARPGEVLRFPDLADTLEEIGRRGESALRDGPLADALLDCMERDGGLVTREDLEAYEVADRTPLRVGYRDTTILTNPPPSSGGILIAAALSALQAAPRPGSDTDLYRACAAAGAQANLLRSSPLMEQMHDEGFIERFWAQLAAGMSRKPVGSTTHVSAIDADGGMASLSSSCGSGSGVVVPGTGILLNNMMGEEDLNPGGFGRIHPGTRMTSMMAPTMVLRGDAPVVALGSAGSNRLRSAILQVVTAIVDLGLDIPAAVARPRIHPEAGALDVEGGVPEEAVAALVADGYAPRRWDALNLFFGGVSAVGAGGSGLRAAGDPRRGGGAAGVTRDGEVVAL
ncbi:MAG: gamma-glutamyltransferase [Actinomycetota bacterium]